MSSPVWPFCASRSTPVTAITPLCLTCPVPFITMSPPRSERRPIPREGSSDARDCRHRRADPAVGLHPVTALRLGNGRVGVDCPISSPSVQHASPGRFVLDACRHLHPSRAARGSVCRRNLGHDGIPLHDSLPSGPLRDVDAVGG